MPSGTQSGVAGNLRSGRMSEGQNGKVSGRETLSVEEAAKILGIGRNSCYAAVKSGAIPSLKIGGRLLVPRAGIERMIQRAIEG
jgi:excisionase family DNA binding protein